MDEWMNNSPIPSPSAHPRHSCSKYLAAMQQVREAYLGEYRAKQAHLLKALSEESALWITEANIDEVGGRAWLLCMCAYVRARRRCPSTDHIKSAIQPPHTHHYPTPLRSTSRRSPTTSSPSRGGRPSRPRGGAGTGSTWRCRACRTFPRSRRRICSTRRRTCTS